MENRVAFVTGAASGLGRAAAHRLAADGFAVFIADIDAEGGGSVAGEIEAAGGWASSARCDVVDRAEIEAASRACIERFGGIDLLVNNAGFENPGFFLQTDPEGWDALVRVNLMGVLNCTYVVGPCIFERARASGYGRIVNIASEAARTGAMGESVYSAAKGGVVSFTKSIAREFARERVTVNVICPGPAETPLVDLLRTSEVGEKMLERMIRATPLRRLAVPEDVAALISYFASPDSSFVTGQVVSVSGGLSMSG